MPKEQTVRPPSVAGLFYPGKPETLRRMVTDLLSPARHEGRDGSIRAVVSPHAGYQYSGPTAGRAFGRLAHESGRIVVVVSPSHREFFDGVSVYPGDAYETPLGHIPVDADLRERLIERCDCVSSSAAGHRGEHAIEVQLPFLQVALGSFSLLPIVIGNQTRRFCMELGDALASLAAESPFLLVASTDLSHFHTDTEARELDAVFVKTLAACDPEGMMADLESGKTEACGGGPTVAVLRAIRTSGNAVVDVVHQCTSGDVTGDRESVVGYVSALAYA